MSPEKYWDVHDDRVSILKRYLTSIKPDSIHLLPVEEIIEICIKALKSFQLTKVESNALKNLILRQNAQILEPCIEMIREEISELNTDKVTLVSLGCGDESLFEKLLDENIRACLPSVGINWLGVDVGDYRRPTSFFNTHPFLAIGSDKFVKYRSLVQEKNSPVILLGRYSYHHIGIDFDEFNKRCVGLKRVVLIEEPTTEKKWLIPDYRFMRVAYDVLANTVFSTSWAEEFSKDASKFKINYIKTEETSSASARVVEFKEALPETAFVSFVPQSN